MKTWIVIPMLAFLAGCATSAKPIPDIIPHALLKFGPAQGVEGIGAYWYENDRCEPDAYSGKVGTLSWMTGREAEATIPAAGKPVYVAQHWVVGRGGAAYTCGGALCIGKAQCSSMVQFVPEQGHTYAAQLVFRDSSCRTQIVDTSNGGNELVHGQQPLASCLKN